MILGLHHAQITIPKGSEDEARAFYCSFLNLPELEKPDALKSRCGFWLQVGDRQVHVGTEDGFLTVIPAGKAYDEKKVKEIDFTTPIYSSPIAANGVLYIATHTHLFAIGKTKAK